MLNSINNVRFNGRLIIKDSVKRDWPELVPQLERHASLVEKLPVDVTYWSKSGQNMPTRNCANNDFWVKTQVPGEPHKNKFITDTLKVCEGENLVMKVLDHLQQFLPAFTK